ncbi:Twinkle protein, mitochondrial [Hondaea fermentalgiana]|uniref:Twinkle protein, mitochondrial n=1 Tax=Hondaea fermentalgiana TaxID=2315210 RepID=A0A2R5GSX4_9STRA|nr:Twinkle protein, mitochondrial [Hondaea fermentalgiana]|eukprot:GBG31753.1 Twinkle protein, mitochondrial [Hondaea fermentalgiana]
MALEAVQPGKPQHDEFKKFMLQRGISMETAKAFYVGVLRNCVAFPKVSQPGTFGPEEVREKLQAALPQGDPRLLDGQYVVQRIKLRGLKEKKFTQSVPGVDLSGLFGWHLVKPSDTEIVITEGEMDALAVYEATKRAVVSLPGGAPAGLTGELVDKIKARFKTVYLWLDNDEVGLAAREKLAQHFGMDTVRFIGQIGQGNKDANDVLMNGGDVEACIRNAKPAFEEPFDSVQDMKELIRNYMLHPEPLGESFDGFPSLTSLVGGFRPGELTILTGPTGSGKTTLLSQLSLHLAQKGVKTLWGSFEIKREALLSNMLRQYAGSLPEKGRAILRPETSFLSDEEVLGRLDQFATLPLYALKFFGATDVVDVLDSVAYSVTEAGMQHVIIDNLQFMVSGGGGLANAPMTSWDRFESMDSAIGHFRQIATQKRCHVTVVIHPRKEKEGDMLSLQSFSGTGKATQEADNVWILQKDKEGMKSLDVKKNRFLGTLGSFPLEFAFPSRSFVDLGDNAVKARSADLDKARSFYADENLEF